MQTATAIDALLSDARRELPALRLLTDVVDREAYRLDETAYLAAGLPGAVALPESTGEVATLLRLRHGRRRWSRLLNGDLGFGGNFDRSRETRDTADNY